MGNRKQLGGLATHVGTNGCSVHLGGGAMPISEHPKRNYEKLRKNKRTYEKTKKNQRKPKKPRKTKTLERTLTQTSYFLDHIKK